MLKHALLCAAFAVPLYAHAASIPEPSSSSGQNEQTNATNKLNGIQGLVMDTVGRPTRLDISGGLAVLGDDAFLSRRIDQSFAVVSIPDYPNVHVLVDNQPAGRTDANGDALIPMLRAYDKNVISIDQRDLPLDAEISTLKLDAVPYFRSGIEMKFPVKHSRGATLTIRLEDGKPLPVGASVQEVGKDEIYTVGYDGEVYVVGLEPTNRLRATWGSQSCEFDVRFTANADPLPDLGTFICQGVKP